MVLASKHSESKLGEDVQSIIVGEAEVEVAITAHNTGDNHGFKAIDMEGHVNQIISACYYNLCNISQKCQNITKQATSTHGSVLGYAKT